MITRAWYPKRKGLNGLLLAAHLPATTADTSSHGNSINTCRIGFFSAAPRCELDCYNLICPWDVIIEYTAHPYILLYGRLFNPV